MPARKEDLRYDEAVAERIRRAFMRAYREGEGAVTQGEAAKIIGMAQPTVGRYESGEYQIPLRVLLLVAERLRVGLDEIVRPKWPYDAGARVREQSRMIELLEEQLLDAKRQLAAIAMGEKAGAEIMGKIERKEVEPLPLERIVQPGEREEVDPVSEPPRRVGKRRTPHRSAR